jgi:predicted acetyltransferase
LFRKITLRDKFIFEDFKLSNYYASELNFANIIAWKELDDLQIFYNDNILIVKGKDFFFPPLVKNNDYQQAFTLMKEYCIQNNFMFNIYGIVSEMLPNFQALNAVTYEHNELDEYLYMPNDLIDYKGKKYHSKRNLVSQFERNYTCQFVSYRDRYLDEIVILIDLWTEQKSLTYEKAGILNLLENLEYLECFCECIIIDNKVQAFSIGTIFNNVGIVLFEKANIEYIGIYPAIVTYFARKHFNGLLYVNRQEDMGIENLRHSKMSYNPIAFIKKYQLTLDIDSQLQNIYQRSFDDSKSYFEYFFTRKEKLTKYITNNNLITASLYFRNELFSINKANLKAAFIFGLATLPYYRRQGFMKSLLEMTFKELSEDTAFVYLNPAISDFYEQFDFVYFGNTPQLNENEDLIPLEHIEDIERIYNQYASHFNIYTVRNTNRWKDIWEEALVDDGYIKLIKKQDQIIGYVICDGQKIIEYCNLENIPSHQNDYNMIRIINLPLLIKTTNYQPNQNLKIVDDLITLNNIELTINEEDIKTISIGEFTKLFLINYNVLAFEKY